MAGENKTTDRGKEYNWMDKGKLLAIGRKTNDRRKEKSNIRKEKN